MAYTHHYYISRSMAPFLNLDYIFRDTSHIRSLLGQKCRVAVLQHEHKCRPHCVLALWSTNNSQHQPVPTPARFWALPSTLCSSPLVFPAQHHSRHVDCNSENSPSRPRFLPICALARFRVPSTSRHTVQSQFTDPSDLLHPREHHELLECRTFHHQ